MTFASFSILRITSGTVAAADLPDMGVVRDGTPCGNNLICMNRTCSSIYPYVDRSKCPSNNVALDCSGHGVCSNVNNCFCDPGWTGHDCSTQTAESYIIGSGSANQYPPPASAITGAPPLVTTAAPQTQTSNSKTTSYGIISSSSLIADTVAGAAAAAGKQPCRNESGSGGAPSPNAKDGISSVTMALTVALVLMAAFLCVALVTISYRYSASAREEKLPPAAILHISLPTHSNY